MALLSTFLEWDPCKLQLHQTCVLPTPYPSIFHSPKNPLNVKNGIRVYTYGKADKSLVENLKENKHTSCHCQLSDIWNMWTVTFESIANTFTVWVELGRRMLYIPLSVTPDRRISAQSRKASSFPFGRLEISEKKTNKRKKTKHALHMTTFWFLHTNPSIHTWDLFFPVF